MAERAHTAQPDSPFDVILWLKPEQESIARRLIERLGWVVSVVGSPGRDASTLARAFDADASEDFRRAITDFQADALVILALGADERDALTAALKAPSPSSAGPMRVFTLEPIAASITDALSLRDARPVGCDLVRQIPGFLATPGAQAAMTSLESFGRLRSLDLAARCDDRQGSLAARLVDAMDFVHAVMGEPEWIDASLSGVEAPSGLRLAPGDSLTSIAGDLNALLRYTDGRAAAVSLSDQAGSWFRGATALGAKGCLRFDDHSFQWTDTQGAVLDESRAGATDASAFADLLADQIAASLDNRLPMSQPGRLIGAYTLAEAALLSARTGVPESPATIRSMTGVS